MAISNTRLCEIEIEGRNGYLYGHPRDLSPYPHGSENNAYIIGWEAAQREHPGIELQKPYR